MCKYGPTTMEYERESKHGQSGPWGMLVTHLPQIAVAERSYGDLGFLLTKNKGFLRKDNSLKSMYDSARSDFRRVEEMTKFTNSDRLPSTFNNEMRTFTSVANELCLFLTARIELIDLYEKMHLMGSGKQMKYEEVLAQVEDIMERNAPSVPQMCLTPIENMLSLECEILIHLLRAQLEMQMWKFFPSLMLLHLASTRLAAWESKLQNRESWKLGFGATFLKTSQLPALLQWLLKLKTVFLAKFSLYFYSTLVQQTSAPEMKTLCGKLQTNDYFHKIQNFQRRYDAVAVMLVFDAHGLEDFKGPGYHHPDKPAESPQDLECYPIAVSCPIKPLNHMPNVVKVITERASELAAMDKVVYYFSPKDQSTYVMACTDPRMTLVVVFDSQKAEKDSHITNFVSDLALQLRCNKVFANLKPNTK
ncbi:KICSTOR complex protein C12orf66-like isoform X2 [Zootermopsis nevadensis]|uniref:KICSTOR complex protein C12orf66-like isoform X2 n=1 Tax=Zootermopsis nevadensis TaxID=136037 RepID=UPI000B8E5B78|nr:KICSTOR complex protein C12orf66-like isoform X2 [Zootermopsis nevadensis]